MRWGIFLIEIQFTYEGRVFLTPYLFLDIKELLKHMSSYKFFYYIRLSALNYIKKHNLTDCKTYLGNMFMELSKMDIKGFHKINIEDGVIRVIK